MRTAPKRLAAPVGASLVVISSVFYASYGIWAKLMGNFFGSFTASALRCILVFALLIGLAIYRQELQKVYWRRDLKWLLIMLISSVFVSGPLYYAILHAGVGISLSLCYVGIVIGMFICGRVFDGEQFTQDKLIASTFGIVGLVLVFSPSLKAVGWLALSAAFLSGLATAVNMATTKKIPYNGSQSAILVWGAGAVANIPLVFILGEPTPVFAWHIAWLYLLIFALASLVASWTFIKGLKLIEAGSAGLLGLLEVVFGVLFGFVFFGERPSPIIFIGIASILAAAAIPYLKYFNAQTNRLDDKVSS